MKQIITLALTVLTTNVVNAQIRIGAPVYGGTGCVNESVITSPPQSQGNRVSGQIKFDGLLINSAQDKNLVSRKACNMRLPVTVDNGFQVAVRVTTLGWVRQSAKVTANLSIQASFVGATATQPEVRTWKAAVNSGFQSIKDMQWSECSPKPLMLALNTSIMTQRQKTSLIGLISVQQQNYEIIARRCQ